MRAQLFSWSSSVFTSVASAGALSVNCAVLLEVSLTTINKVIIISSVKGRFIDATTQRNAFVARDGPNHKKTLLLSEGESW
jgi:hypothetical protein